MSMRVVCPRGVFDAPVRRSINGLSAPCGRTFALACSICVNSFGAAH
jgi:hypothetical protein